MTDNDIIKALECCIKDDYDKGCMECPVHCYKGCDFHLAKFALALINRQKAEIERHREHIELLDIEHEAIKISAIKEFAERLKHMLGLINGFDYDCSTIFYHIDNLVKEMVGE